MQKSKSLRMFRVCAGASVKRPERLRILGKRFTVQYSSGAPLDDGLNGECDSDNQKILVRDGQPLESEQDTLLHEVLHAIDEAMGLKMKEAQVKGAATGLLAVLKDNASLGSYLKKK
jgi:hypothetical protein